MKRFAFVLDPLEKLDLAWDTSLCLLRKLHARGHQTFLFLPDSLSLESGQVKGRGRQISPVGENRYRQSPKKRFDLARFDAVFIRKDPPFDAHYLALTYLLEPLARETLVINHPRGIRNANEKLFGLNFGRWSPPTLVSSDADEILRFQKKIRSDLVVKPLYEKGGKGVFLLPEKQRTGRWNKTGDRSLEHRSDTTCPLFYATRKGKQLVVAQKFIPVPKGTGDKRILLWKGKILGVFQRIPQAGEFRSNLSLGARFTACKVTQAEKNLVRDLKPELLREGLYFVGIDVRAEKLIEVNVTSPAGLVELDRLYGEESTRKMILNLNVGARHAVPLQ